MRIFLIAIAASVAISLAGCGSKETPVETAQLKTVKPAVVQPPQPAQLSVPKEPSKPAEPKDPFCSKPVGTTAKEILAVMDHDLDSTAAGKETCGSFTDYFVPNAGDALKAGASKRQVQARIDRAVALAEKGLFISSYEKGLFTDGGAKAVREYAQSVFDAH